MIDATKLTFTELTAMDAAEVEQLLVVHETAEAVWSSKTSIPMDDGLLERAKRKKAEIEG